MAALSNLVDLCLLLLLAVLAPVVAIGTGLVYLACLLLTIADNLSLGLRPFCGVRDA